MSLVQRNPVENNRVHLRNTLTRMIMSHRHLYGGDLHHFQRLTWLIENEKNEQQNNALNPKNNVAAGYQPVVPVKLELF